MTLAVFFTLGKGGEGLDGTYPRRLCQPLRRSCIGIGEGHIRFSSLNRTRVDTRVPWPRGPDSDERRMGVIGWGIPMGSGSVAIRTGGGAWVTTVRELR